MRLPLTYSMIPYPNPEPGFLRGSKKQFENCSSTFFSELINGSKALRSIRGGVDAGSGYGSWLDCAPPAQVGPWRHGVGGATPVVEFTGPAGNHHSSYRAISPRGSWQADGRTMDPHSILEQLLPPLGPLSRPHCPQL